MDDGCLDGTVDRLRIDGAGASCTAPVIEEISRWGEHYAKTALKEKRNA